MATDINRTTAALPAEVASEILQKTQEDSAVMSLARQITLPGLGLTIPVITGDPEASWVAETEKKPVSRGTLDTKIMMPYTLAVIVPFSNQFKRDIPSLYDALVERLPRALAQKFDATVFGAATAPGDKFDTLSKCKTFSIGATDAAFDGLVAADAEIAANDGILNGWALSPKGKSALLSAKDGNGRPLFINSAADGAIPMVLGAPVKLCKAAAVTASNIVGYAGDWTQAMYGTVEGVQVTISDQATLTDGSNTINLFQNNMFAVRAEIEVGFRCDTSVFSALTYTAE